MHVIFFQLLIPIVLYTLFTILDAAHTMSILRFPGKLINSIVNTDENNLLFLTDSKSLFKSFGRDTYLLNWFYPNQKYSVDADFEQAYLKSKGVFFFAKFLGVFTICVALLVLQFKAQLFTTGSVVAYMFISCLSLVVMLGFYKYFGRILYRLSLLAIMNIFMLKNALLRFIKSNILTPLHATVRKQLQSKKLSNLANVKEYILDSISDIIDDTKKQKPIDESFLPQLDNGQHKSLLSFLEPIIDQVFDKSTEFKDKVTVDDVQKVLNDIQELCIEKFRTSTIKVLSKKYIPNELERGNAILYNFIEFPISSSLRFLLLDSKGTQLMIALVIVAYLVSSGYTTASHLLGFREGNANDELEDDPISIQQTISQIGKTTLGAFVCISLYCILIIILRQLLLVWLASIGRNKQGTKTITGYICEELLSYSHDFKVPELVLFKEPVAKLTKMILKLGGVVCGAAFILMCAYVLLTYKPDTEDTLKATHYVEGTKTIAIGASLIVVVVIVLQSL